MPTNTENISDIRDLLDSPNPQMPHDRLLFRLLNNQILHHQSQLQNASAAWAVNEWVLTVSNGTEDYLIAAPDFGKPFLCYAEDPTDLRAPRMEIPFCKLSNINQFYSGPRQVLTSNSNTNLFTATVFTFYRKFQGWYVRVTPMPGGNGVYRIWYEVLPTMASSLGDSPGLSPFHHLLRVQTAMAAIPYCAWGDVSSTALSAPLAAAWERKTKSLSLALGMQQAQFERQFETYIGTLSEAGVERRLGFGDDYMNGTEWGYINGSLAPNQWG